MIDSIGKLKLDNKALILVFLIAALILYLDYNFVLKAQLNGVNSLKPKIVKIKKDIELLNKDLANIESLKNRQSQQPGVKVKNIIIEEQLPELLEVISNAANNNNIRIMQIKPIRDVKTKEDKAITAAKLTPNYINLDLIGSYHNFANFLNDLENGEKYVAAQDLKIKREENNFMKESITLVLKTYVKK